MTRHRALTAGDLVRIKSTGSTGKIIRTIGLTMTHVKLTSNGAMVTWALDDLEPAPTGTHDFDYTVPAKLDPFWKDMK